MNNKSRRQFFTQFTQGAAVAATGGLAWFYLLNEQSHASAWAIRPPGGEAVDEFYAKCIKCGKCVDACPFDTLKLASAGVNIPIGTPYFVPREIPCYMCLDIPCQEACPTGAISSDLEHINDAQMGLATIDIENCLSWQGLRCEICHRECPVQNKAITIEHHPRRLSKHAMFVPIVHGDHCTGCGVCEKVCPTEKAAIRVVKPEYVQGKIGEHYRLGWKTDTPITQEFTPSESTTSPGQSTEQALDYLNQDSSL